MKKNEIRKGTADNQRLFKLFSDFKGISPEKSYEVRNNSMLNLAIPDNYWLLGAGFILN